MEICAHKICGIQFGNAIQHIFLKIYIGYYTIVLTCSKVTQQLLNYNQLYHVTTSETSPISHTTIGAIWIMWGLQKEDTPEMAIAGKIWKLMIMSFPETISNQTPWQPSVPEDPDTRHIDRPNVLLPICFHGFEKSNESISTGIDVFRVLRPTAAIPKI